jgi:shikimate kinase
LNIPRPENVVLVGFMGSGKSSVGRLVARTLRGRFVDTDRLVIDRAGCPIAEIFATRGEAHFRQEETRALRSLLGSSRLVIATGGGIVTAPENLPVLKKLGFVVWLTASEEVIWERVSRNTRRPLLQTENPRETVRELIAKRNPLYEEAADMEVDTTTLTHAQVAERIYQRLMERRR